MNKILPREITTRILIFLLIFFLVSFMAGKMWGESILTRKIELVQVEKDNLQRDLSKKEQELLLILQNRASFVKSTKEKYSYSLFGIYSPELVEKTMINTFYNYRRNSIIHRAISLSNNTNVDSWEFASVKSTSQDPNYYTDYAIFVGYENNGNPTMMSELEKQWKNSYLTKNGIMMYWSYLYLPKGGIMSVNLDSFLGGRPTGHPMLLRISKGIEGFTEKENSLEVQRIKKEIEKVADTINLQVKH